MDVELSYASDERFQAFRPLKVGTAIKSTPDVDGILTHDVVDDDDP